MYAFIITVDEQLTVIKLFSQVFKNNTLEENISFHYILWLSTQNQGHLVQPPTHINDFYNVL